jgi:glucose-6-phosphate 1-dehydrogenase
MAEFIGEFFGESEVGTCNIVYRSRTNPGSCYEFRIKIKTNNRGFAKLRCSGCRSLKKDTYIKAAINLEEKSVQYVIEKYSENQEYEEIFKSMQSTETVRRLLVYNAKPKEIFICVPSEIDEELQVSFYK